MNIAKTLDAAAASTVPLLLGFGAALCGVAGGMYAKDRAFVRAAICWYASAALACDAVDAWERRKTGAP